MNSPDQNPFQTPNDATFASAPLGESPNKVRSVGKAQRLVNIAILLYLCLIGLNVIVNASVARSGGQSPLAMLMLPLGLGVLIFIMVAVWRLAYSLHGTGNAVIYCLAMLIPCVGLILLVFLNSRATAYLKAQGVRVGLLGADPSSLPR